MRLIHKPVNLLVKELLDHRVVRSTSVLISESQFRDFFFQLLAFLLLLLELPLQCLNTQFRLNALMLKLSNDLILVVDLTLQLSYLVFQSNVLMQVI